MSCCLVVYHRDPRRIHFVGMTARGAEENPLNVRLGNSLLQKKCTMNALVTRYYRPGRDSPSTGTLSKYPLSLERVRPGRLRSMASTLRKTRFILVCSRLIRLYGQCCAHCTHFRCRMSFGQFRSWRSIS